MIAAASAAFGQEANAARSDSWYGVNLGSTTPIEAIEILGRRAADKAARLIPRWVEERFVGLRETALRRLEYRGRYKAFLTSICTSRMTGWSRSN
jgi:hypothetical protein